MSINIKVYAYVFVCFTLITSVPPARSACDQPSFDKAEVDVFLSKKWIIQTVADCVNPDSSAADAQFVILKSPVQKFRRGTFRDFPTLEGIHATTVTLKTVLPGAFLNLPKLRLINLRSNYVEEILHGIFTGMEKLEELDLSSNSISYIEGEAFSNVPSLRNIFLQRNRLGNFNKVWFKNSSSIRTLNLSYNKLRGLVPRSFNTFPNLTVLDLSFNEIFDIGSELFGNVKVLRSLDLTKNNLTALNVGIFDGGVIVERLRLPLNKLSFLPEEILIKAAVKFVSLQPNPWQCPCLDRLISWIALNNVTILNPNMDYRLKWDSNLAHCAFKSNTAIKCELKYDAKFLDTQETYFDAVIRQSIIKEMPTEKPPVYEDFNLDKFLIQPNLSSLS